MMICCTPAVPSKNEPVAVAPDPIRYLNFCDRDTIPNLFRGWVTSLDLTLYDLELIFFKRAEFFSEHLCQKRLEKTLRGSKRPPPPPVRRGSFDIAG